MFFTIYICTINLLLLFDNTTGMTHLKILHHYMQVLATVGPMAAITSSGMTTGFTAVLLPQLEATGCPIPLTANEAYWVGKLDL